MIETPESNDILISVNIKTYYGTSSSANRAGFLTIDRNLGSINSFKISRSGSFETEGIQVSDMIFEDEELDYILAAGIHISSNSVEDQIIFRSDIGFGEVCTDLCCDNESLYGNNFHLENLYPNGTYYTYESENNMTQHPLVYDNIISNSWVFKHLYFGVDDELTEEYICVECFGYLQNSQNLTESNLVCSDHGECTNYDICTCSRDYEGKTCETAKTKCYGELYDNFTSSTLCSSHGNCTSEDNCQCSQNYYGSKCEVTTCFDIYSNHTETVCSGHGECYLYNECACFPGNGYFSSECEDYECFGTLYNNTDDVCSSHGNCEAPDNCVCEEYWYEENCDVYECAGFFSNSTMCNGNGECSPEDAGHENCKCHDFYYGKFCDVYECAGFLSNETMCNDHGVCNIPGNDVCNCFSDYYGETCEIFSCNNLTATDTDNVCNGHGSCIAFETCICFSGYSDNPESEVPCDDWYCGTHYKNNINVCNQRGDCIGSHLCECKDNYEGELCETWSCGFEHTSPSVCSGNGKCTSPGVCECDDNYDGEKCETNLLLVTVLAPTLSVATIAGIVILGIIAVFIALCICCLVCSFCFAVFVLGCLLCCVSIMTLVVSLVTFILRLRVKKFSKLKNFDILMKEQEMEEDTSIAHIDVNRSLFEVEFEEITILKILGEGGSNSVVYLAKWSGSEVAFKCFKTRSLCTSQNSFDVKNSNTHPKKINIQVSILPVT